MSTTTTQPKATCRYCGKRVIVKPIGILRIHKDRKGEYCAGNNIGAYDPATVTRSEGN